MQTYSVLITNALGYAISTIFTILSVLLSGWEIWTHLTYNPVVCVRKYILHILLMVPIFEKIRDCYEVFALHSFYCFLVVYLGGQSVLANTLRIKKQLLDVNL
ncbi:hypothetical protein SDRG_17355 [Saprolegnia diclina VS20]|uniref:Uncharacterized protein n=1 Tax=Saprolegnia diclina (strain VS20) TaxID=1156394 RepID=T0R5G2_SAPDV|nr:hypothetical protein SDRG_17355 [Saprolegnia diclina VS20]EQC24752.1 hypothetical protein SDRG_17355 [Saprolegnia diclina VS20]|eukprot:XP_008621819.1 hypothetical protein SDRG_17355 [Saprolegnia diclina VS20]